MHFQESVSYSLFINTSNKMTSETMVEDYTAIFAGTDILIGKNQIKYH